MPMQRYVNGLWFEGEVVPDKWVVRTWECNGVMERSAVPYVQWREVADFGFKRDDWNPFDDSVLTDDQREEMARERAERSLRKSCQRSKTTARRAIIAEGFNELMTLTYRENQGDRRLCKQHFEAWVRKMKRALGGVFRYCAAFERQERGAMHVHIACHRLPQHVDFKESKIKSYELGTRLWRSIVGEGNGLCFVGGRSKFGGPARRRMSLAKMAAYVSKYILKDSDDVPKGENRFSRSIGAPLPEVHALQVDCSYADLIGLVYEYQEGDSVLALRPSRFKDRLWFCKESGPVS